MNNRLKKFSEFVDSLYEVSRVFHNYDKKPRCYGTDIKLYEAEMHLLDKICNNEGLTVTALADMTNKTKSAITQMTKKLEKKNMIQKLRNKEYHKEINLYTTQLGKEVCDYHRTLDEKNYLEALKYFEDYDVEDFQKCIKAAHIMIKFMEEYSQNLQEK